MTDFLSSLVPSYFHFWHLPVVFLAGLIGEGYGVVIGSGGILIQFVLAALGLPLASVVATDLAGVLGADIGVIQASPRKIWANKKLLILLTVPLFIGGIIGTIFLIHISALVLKYILIIGLILLLARMIAGNKKLPQPPSDVRITPKQYPLLFSVMSLLGIYGNVSGVGVGTFQKLAFVSILRISFADSVGIACIIVLPSAIFSIIFTAMHGLVLWPYALTLGIGNYIGSKYATKYVQKIPENYLRAVLLVVTVGYLAYLLFSLMYF